MQSALISVAASRLSLERCMYAVVGVGELIAFFCHSAEPQAQNSTSSAAHDSGSSVEYVRCGAEPTKAVVSSRVRGIIFRSGISFCAESISSTQTFSFFFRTDK